MILECKIAFILNKNFINSVNNTDICRKLFVILSGENMSRNVHDIYDVILKIIILVYKEEFLEFIGVNKNIKEVLKTEFVTFDGHCVILNFSFQKQGRVIWIGFLTITLSHRLLTGH